MMQTPQPTTPLPSYTTAVWATTLIEEVEALTVSCGKVEKTVDSINLKVTSMEKRLENLETNVMDVASSWRIRKTTNWHKKYKRRHQTTKIFMQPTWSKIYSSRKAENRNGWQAGKSRSPQHAWKPYLLRHTRAESKRRTKRLWCTYQGSYHHENGPRRSWDEIRQSSSSRR